MARSFNLKRIFKLWILQLINPTRLTFSKKDEKAAELFAQNENQSPFGGNTAIVQQVPTKFGYRLRVLIFPRDKGDRFAI